jgi:signal transduction histidine kinase
MKIYHKEAYRHGQPSRYLKFGVFSFGLGPALIAGLTLYVITRDYRTTLEVWKSTLSADASYRTWILQNSLQQSQDDIRVLADFAATGDLLFLGTRESPDSGSVAATRKRVLGLFENYRKIYEYSAIYLIGDKNQTVVQATDSGAWLAVIQNPKVQGMTRSAIQERHFEMDLVRLSEKEVALVFVMPVLAVRPTDKNAPAPLGVVAMVSFFDRDLLPLLKAERVPTRTGEVLFLQVKGDASRYASTWRFTSPRQAGRRSRPDTLLPAAASSAVKDRPLSGQFTDYRGTSVIASIQKIPALNGVVVAKIDYAEAFADFERLTAIEAIAAGSAIFAYIGLMLLLRRNALEREMRETEQSLRADKEILEAKVAERTTELTKLNELLQVELTEIEKAEEEVRRVNAGLEDRVLDRTAQLESANKELEAFAYSVSHDLRAPLRAIGGISEILVREYSANLPEEGQHFLHRVGQNSVLMEKLILGLLSFSRLSRQALHKESVALADLMRQAWDDLIDERAGRTVDLTVGLLPVCQGDPLLLKQVCLNLLSNAIKYTRIREIATITAGSTDGGAYYVRDNGVGFDMRYGDQLFGVFQRLHRAEDYEGTGVGLAIVQRIVQRHGGRVWADAAPNRGATFYFTLARPDTGDVGQTKAPNNGADSHRLPMEP